ncbi:arginine deiminase-related protein [Pseudomonas sp. LFM046]|uniref:dimethylarginine dimethylaminohydrolase family protein n=1 Tax=Pseudomonas sp. LFM046 TaxID=1608357 RepID=UPI000B3280A0|nr:arginine deiminase-related protein [Pseudomonas sp. LFM046]
MKPLATLTADEARNTLNPAIGLEPGALEPELEEVEISFGKEARQPVLKSVSPWLNPTQLERPSFLLNFPFSYSTEEPNNSWMTEMSEQDRQPDFVRACIQFYELYRYISAEALVYILPTPHVSGLQDLLYTANLGIVLEHLSDRNTVVISNFTSKPRRGETAVGVSFFQSMGYDVYVPATKFEGEAELKHLYGNHYIGGYGLRSEKETYDWMEEKFDMKIVKLPMTDPYLYHLDCVVFPITRENTLVCTELLEKQKIAELERLTNIIDVSLDDCYSGICNSVRLPSLVLNSSHIHSLKAGTEEYAEEVRKNRRLEDIAADLALEVSYFNLSEFHKSGALLSCMVMHLNRHCYKIALTA